MNIAKMMKQAQQMQKKMGEIQKELSIKEFESSVGGGKVRVVANGEGKVLSIKIDPSVVNDKDVEMLEDLVLSGVKQAISEAKSHNESEMKKVSSGMGLPPGIGF